MTNQTSIGMFNYLLVSLYSPILLCFFFFFLEKVYSYEFNHVMYI